MNDARESRSSLSERLLEAGFWSGVVISLICLLACFGYLFLFLLQSSQGIESLLSSKLPQDREAVIFAINGRMVTARLALLSCGISVGLAFGFLGFSLFLLGIKGNVTANLSTGDFKARFANLSPGLFVLLCSTVLVGVCVTRSLPFTFEVGPTSEPRTIQSVPSAKKLLGDPDLP